MVIIEIFPNNTHPCLFALSDSNNFSTAISFRPKNSLGSSFVYISLTFLPARLKYLISYDVDSHSVSLSSALFAGL